MKSFFKTNQLGATKQSGFTITEFIVTTAILSVMFTVLVYNQSNYSNKLVLQSAADKMASTISQAQAYGKSVKELTPGSNQFNVPYGVAFNIGPWGSIHDYFYFADVSPINGLYDGGVDCAFHPDSECLEKITLPQGLYISQICVLLMGGAEDCHHNIERLYITFNRPNVNASIKFFTSGGIDLVLPNTVGAKIVIQSVQGGALVLVYNSGQVSVQ